MVNDTIGACPPCVVHEACYLPGLFDVKWVHCIAFGCSHNSSNIARGVSFFRLPLKKPDLLKSRLAKLFLLDPPISKNSHVCSNHFKPECFERNLKLELLGTKAIRHLKPNAVPTIFAFAPSKAKRTTGRKQAHAAKVI